MLWDVFMIKDEINEAIDILVSLGINEEWISKISYTGVIFYFLCK